MVKGEEYQNVKAKNGMAGPKHRRISTARNRVLHIIVREKGTEGDSKQVEKDSNLNKGKVEEHENCSTE